MTAVSYSSEPTDGDWAEVLARFPLFSKVGKRKLRKVAREAHFAEIAPGEEVIARGAPADSFYVILGGEAAVRDRPRAPRLTTGDYFGEMALIDGGTRTASVVATEELHLMRLPRRSFMEVVGERGVAMKILETLGSRLRRVEQRA
jgi:CRP/FNR family transcriptional regulator, cyclic AMP receptor protein